MPCNRAATPRCRREIRPMRSRQPPRSSRPAACAALAAIRGGAFARRAAIPARRSAAAERPAAAAGEAVLPPRAVVVPGFWDPRRRPERPDLSRIQTFIRFLTNVDYPPFDYTGVDGNPAGFNVDLARLICEEIKITCTIQARPFGTLLEALNGKSRRRRDRFDFAPTPETAHATPDFTDPYFRTPARFLSRAPTARSPRCCRSGFARGDEDRGDRRHRARGLSQDDVHRSRGSGRTPTPKRSAPTPCGARRSIFCSATSIALAFWLNGTDSGGCCAFSRRAVSWKAAFSAKGSASRFKPGQRPAAAFP